MGNLIESQLEDLGVNPLDEAVRVDIDFTEIQVSLEEGNRPILEDDVKDEKADIVGRQSGQIGRAMPSGKVVIGACPV